MMKKISLVNTACHICQDNFYWKGASLINYVLGEMGNLRVRFYNTVYYWQRHLGIYTLRFSQRKNNRSRKCYRWIPVGLPESCCRREYHNHLSCPFPVRDLTLHSNRYGTIGIGMWHDACHLSTKSWLQPLNFLNFKLYWWSK